MNPLFEMIIDILSDHRAETGEIHRVVSLLKDGITEMSDKFDALEASLSALEAKVAAVQVPVVEDDSGEIASLQARVDKLTADLAAKEGAPVVDNGNAPTVADIDVTKPA